MNNDYKVAMIKETGELVIVERAITPDDGSPTLLICRQPNSQATRTFISSEIEIVEMPEGAAV